MDQEYRMEDPHYFYLKKKVLTYSSRQRKLSFPTKMFREGSGDFGTPASEIYSITMLNKQKSTN